MMLQCGKGRLDLSRPHIMGILNVTPDSFSDGGRFIEPSRALDHARQMMAEGADIIDIGGESTRPGAEAVSEEDELARVLPILEILKSETDVPVSVDTSKPGVMRRVIAAGADIINDVRGFQDPQAVEAVADSQVGLCIMHMLGEPRTMQSDPRYREVVREIRGFLMDQAAVLMDAGVDRHRIMIDPGFGFGKTLEHNLTLLRELGAFSASAFPVLVGMSRKSMIGKVIDRPVEERVHGSVAVASLAAWLGASVVRVHDVAATRDALAMIQAVKATAPA
ncbi:dihydropteroate synthase [Gammaproteobacteria bacterium AB-CW1]|uniref:Dihydropteroate synthase n=1 Tax=Natronospira elongata TaxID=3110268 RepID=A0AAP6JG16_9GAMM|nr:dihydropteroate synthase [Gammaproteobacteria bacterium AB-CW1]